MNDNRYRAQEERSAASPTTLPGYPIAHPIAAESKPSSTSAQHPIVVTNDGAHTGTTAPPSRRARYVSAAALAVLADRLSERDHAVLGSIAEHRFLTVRHVQSLHFADHAPTSGIRIARRTLARLRTIGLLGTLERRVGGLRAGSAGLVHYLSDAGHQLLHGRRRHRTQHPTERFVNHRLAIADAHIGLGEAHRHQQLLVASVALEPASWRVFAAVGGGRATVKPDMYAETANAAPSDFVHAWFIEVDLGTESIPTVLRKCRDYETYRRSGVEQDRSGGFPRVIWSVTHSNPDRAERRRAALREAIANDHSLPDQLFRVIAPQQLIHALQSGGQQ